MELEDLGFDDFFAEARSEAGLETYEVARVTKEHKERYTLHTGSDEYDGEISGHLRFTAAERSDFPAVGDWVVFLPFDGGMGIIHQILPRKTLLERQAVGKHGEKQIIAANIDTAFIVQAADRDFNLNRLERYLTICLGAGITPIILVNKIDLVEKTELDEMVESIEERIPNVPILLNSNETEEGLDSLKAKIETGKTYCLIGSSGVGKSTLVNKLSEADILKTRDISDSNSKGRHTTSHRELVVLGNGGIVIDTPGMRELGMTDNAEGISQTFEQIEELAQDCKYSDCTHQQEEGCAVLEALENNELDTSVFENYMKMQREQFHFQATVAEKRKRDKSFGKMYRAVSKERKKNKY
ncbi:ribosome small subunit-dependent GTPase A [Flammeovirgaceae bacterium SG7u.111]|nr:ribosome small subunit-dependent GTPase A [Flammeovirgaceae bacterium SG7u.132]WPO38108.1 ribosome small subunit-dependent GTPase A [Flammeovirgaceae bacterium SG7u.111]